jgi:phytoene dehydrogenase-like protein
MKVAVIGAGLGGLLSASILSEMGYSVEIFEKLPFIGGRFTSFKYRGYEITTGALHMIPHGSRGPLAELLRKAGAKVEIIDSNPYGTALYGGEEIDVNRRRIPLRSKVSFALLCMKNWFREVKLSELERRLDDFSAKFLRAFLGWSFSITPEQTTLTKIYPVYRSILEHGGPGVPVGGCKAVVDALVDVIRSNDCAIRKLKVSAIRNGNCGFSVYFENGDTEKFDIIISNIGHEETAKLMGIKKYVKLEPSRGIKYSISVRQPFIEHTGVLFTLNTRRISGMNQVTNADPNLGKGNFLMAHQPMLTSNVKFEISEGLKDLKELLKGYDYEILAIQSFSDGWPVNRAIAGSDSGCKTPVSGVYVVGDGAKGSDIEVDGIALGVKDTVEYIRKSL